MPLPDVTPTSTSWTTRSVFSIRKGKSNARTTSDHVHRRLEVVNKQRRQQQQRQQHLRQQRQQQQRTFPHPVWVSVPLRPRPIYNIINIR